MKALTMRWIVCAGLVLLGSAGLAPAATAGTLENLQAAFDGESNARARYLAFAEKADEEGYGAAASLFRAAARAEDIHRTNHAAVIRQMGAEPRADGKTATPRTTKTNLLKSASKGEAYERDTMYPAFIAQAEADGNAAAVRTFEYAREAEAGHFELFTASAKALAKGPGRDYYVCTVSGYTMTSLVAERCPGGAYEVVN